MVPHIFNRRLTGISESPTRRIDRIREELSRRGVDVILLSTGQPNIPPPDWVREFLADQIMSGGMELFSYTPVRGRREVVEAVRNDLAEDGLDIGTDNIMLTAGGQSALYSALATLFNEGDEVIVFDPLYFGYQPLLNYFRLKAKVVVEDVENGFQPDPDRVAESIERGRTRGIIIVSPDNPTGRVLRPSIAKALAELSIDYDLWLIVDEAYRTLIYEGEHVYLYNYAPENVVSLGSFSKDPGIPGWRLGYAYGPKKVIEKMSLVTQETVYCPPSIAQVLVGFYLSSEEKRRFRQFIREVYRKRRDATVSAIREYISEARFVVPQGGMFLFIDFSRIPGFEDPEVIANRLLLEYGVAVIPGNYFSERYKRSLRLSFVSEPEYRIREGIRKIGVLLGLTL